MQVTKGTWCMRQQCVPGSISSFPTREPGHQAKVDVRSAYWMLPIHPDDRWLLGMRWEGSVFVDTALPFGLWSAPKVFTAVADALEWIVKCEGVSSVIYYCSLGQ